jgi:hypothetical protein
MMDLAKSVLIQKVLKLKGEALRFMQISPAPPSCESPFKILRHLIQLLAIRILSKGAMNPPRYWELRYDACMRCWDMCEYTTFLLSLRRDKFSWSC